MWTLEFGNMLNAIRMPVICFWENIEKDLLND